MRLHAHTHTHTLHLSLKLVSGRWWSLRRCGGTAAGVADQATLVTENMVGEPVPCVPGCGGSPRGMLELARHHPPVPPPSIQHRRGGGHVRSRAEPDASGTPSADKRLHLAQKSGFGQRRRWRTKSGRALVSFVCRVSGGCCAQGRAGTPAPGRALQKGRWQRGYSHQWDG